LRISYTGIQISEINPATKSNKEWIPYIWCRLGYGHQKTPRFQCVVDSGSSTCLFRRDIADYLKIDLTKANVGVSAIGGIIQGPEQPVYFCPVQLYVADNWVINVTAGFLKKLTVPGLLGRNGFFDAFKVSFDHYVSPPVFEIERINVPN
jgi:hypothetical protein